MDRDEREEPTGTPEDGSDWSIEDFDDFSSFDELDLGSGTEPQPQLDFGADASTDETAWLVDEDPADEPTEAGPLDVAGSEIPQEPASAADSEDAGAETATAPEEASLNALGLDAPMEPEASMERPVPPADELTEVEPEVVDFDEIPDFANFTHEHYVQATTQEYAGLAEELARAAGDQPEQMAVSAEIPGLESGVVGLEDVLDAGGDPSVVAAGRSGSDLSVRVLTAIALISVFFGSLYQDYLIAMFIFVVMFIAAIELYVVLIRVGFRPMTLFGLIGVGGALFGAWYWGPIAIPMAIILTTIATLVFFGVVAHRREPLLDTALTVLVLAWIGGLGALAMDIAWAPDYAWMIAAVVVITALMDVAQYFVGRRFGKRPLAPRVSPKKTVEGLIGGIVVALGVGAIFGSVGAPFDIIDGIILGVIVAVVAPFGDLAVSVVKRAIGVKDMGAILPGHGGVLDRIDAMIFVIPAAWVAYSWMGLIAP